jgi:DNA-binding IclR family transcriptional regulator
MAEFARIAGKTGAGDTRSLHRAVGLLRLLSTHTQIGWRISDLARQSGLDLATAHRLLRGLADEELVTRVPGTRRYTLGALAFQVGIAAAPYFDLDRLVGGPLSALARELQGTLFLKVRSAAESVCIARYEGPHPEPSLLLEVGGRRPLCLTAGGVAILLALPPAGQQTVERENARVILEHGRDSWARVQRMLARSRQYGFGVNLGDMLPGICALSVPVPAGDRSIIASLSLALACDSLAERRIAALRRRLQEAAAALEPAFGRLRY